MKKIFSLLLLGIAVLTFAFNRPALADTVTDTAKGAKIFTTACVSCHAGGKNLVQPQKTLKKDALEKFSMNSMEAIVTQVTNGKNAMPSFKSRLKPEQIQNVAAYVLEKADKGW